MKKKLKGSLLLLVLCILCAGCGKEKEVKDENKVKWLIPHKYIAEESLHPVKEEKINTRLKKDNANYTIEICTYPDNSTWEEVKKIAEKEQADIVHLQSAVNETSFIDEAIKEGYCEEIENDYPNCELLKYKGKLYGYGNIEISTPVGVSYSKRFVDTMKLSVKNMNAEIYKNEDVMKEFVGKYPYSLECLSWPQYLSTKLIVEELFYVDTETGECGYIFEAPETVAHMEECVELISKGYRRSPNVNTFGKAKEPDIFLGSSGNGYEKYGEICRDSIAGREEVFFPIYYPYRQNNYMWIENVIRKDSKHLKDSQDFLEKLYGDEIYSNLIAFGKEKPEFTVSENPAENVQNLPDNIALCNENIIDDDSAWTKEKKEEAYREYKEQYKNSKIEGFCFEPSEEEQKKMDEIHEIIYLTEDERSDEYNSLLCKDEKWKENWASIKKQVDEKGGQEIIKELQRQVNAYMGK